MTNLKLSSSVINSRDLQILPGLGGLSLEGTYHVVTKCKAGFPIVDTIQAKSPYEVFSRKIIGAIMSISFRVDDRFNATLYARAGKKVWIAEELAREIIVADINDGAVMSRTSLYNSEQYEYVNAKTWADKVFVENIQEEVLDEELRERFPLNIEGPNMPLETLVSI